MSAGLGHEAYDRAAGGDGRWTEDQWLRRQRLERQLHDGAALRLSALSLQLGVLHHRAHGAGCGWPESISELQDELHTALQELREVAANIYPPVLDEAGLAEALRELAAQTDVSMTVTTSTTSTTSPGPAGDHPPVTAPAAVTTSARAKGAPRFGPAAEAAAYFAVRSCVTALPAAAPVQVDIGSEPEPAVEPGVGPDGDQLVVTIAGIGGGVLELVRGEVAPVGGSVELGPVPAVAAARGPATVITVRLPCG